MVTPDYRQESTYLFITHQALKKQGIPLFKDKLRRSFVWDMRYNPSNFQDSGTFSQLLLLHQWATSSSERAIQFRVDVGRFNDYFPLWTVRTFDNYGVTVKGVLSAIYAFLDTLVTMWEWNTLPTGLQCALEASFFERCGLPCRPRQKWRNGQRILPCSGHEFILHTSSEDETKGPLFSASMKRIDCLLGRTVFVGLQPVVKNGSFIGWIVRSKKC